MNYIYPDIHTANNDIWITDRSVNATPVSKEISNSMIEGVADSKIDGGYGIAERSQPNFYKRFGVDIVAETVFNYPYPYITEKTIRPIACKRMFIIVGAPGVLTILHKKGFKTFSPFINEDYDNIKNNTKRFHAVTTEIKKVLTMSTDNIKKAMYQYSDCLEHNLLVLQNLTDIEISDFKKCLK
jgi:hypothetical protein